MPSASKSAKATKSKAAKSAKPAATARPKAPRKLARKALKPRAAQETAEVLNSRQAYQGPLFRVMRDTIVAHFIEGNAGIGVLVYMLELEMFSGCY